MRIVQKAYAKINWSLNVLRRREDGYHELDMLMQPLMLCDELVFETSRWVTLTIKGQRLPTGERNLVIQAANALKAISGFRGGARILLRKRIPMRAGLGGGSADCAASLIALNKLWNAHIPLNRLLYIAAKLGGDVPFCLKNCLCRVEGIGDRLTPLPNAASIPMVLLPVGCGLSTPPVFMRYDALPRENLSLDCAALADALARRDLVEAQRVSCNALEAPAMEMMPSIRVAMERLRASGADFVRMTGSGSTVFGAYASEDTARRAAMSIPNAIFTYSYV